MIDFLNFSTIFLNELGVFSGFSQREGKLSAAKFVNSCIELCRVKGWSGSLTDHCVVLYEQYGLLLEEQSLNERFTEKSEQLMRYIFDLVMRTHLRDGNPMNLLAQFEEVYVEDSTNLELPHCLHTLYKGSGGGASTAGLKIDATYGLRWGNLDLMFHHGAGSDTWQGIPMMKKGALLLRDLGYFRIHDFISIAENDAYFLSRYRFSTNVYEAKNEDVELNLLALLETMAENETRSIEVYVGAAKLLEARMVLQKVPKAVADYKRHKLKTDKQSNRNKITPQRLAFCDANCYITNIPEQMMTDQDIINLYGLRWIIEILFKAWKSIAKLKGPIRSMKPARFMCMLYAQMIRILIDTKIVQYFKIELWNLFSHKISELKAFNVLATFSQAWWKALRSATTRATHDLFDKITEAMIAFSKKRKPSKKESYNDFYIFVNSQT